jgi:hypothetical protein
MIDRRKNPREFFVAGWDPYILSLVSDGKAWDQRLDPIARTREPEPTRWTTIFGRRYAFDAHRWLKNRDTAVASTTKT